MDPNQRKNGSRNVPGTKAADSGKSGAIQESQGEKKMSQKLELTFFQRLQISRYGQVAIGKETRPDWKGPLMFYAFRCPKHGYVKSYVKGFDQRLECPKCWEDAHGA